MSASLTALFSPTALASFFDSQTWIVGRNIGLFFVAVFWLSVGYWVYKDARRRIEDPWLVAMSTLLGLIPPFIGALIYMLFRPPEYLEEVHERELEIRAMEGRLRGEDLQCPVCRAEIEAGFLVCPVCTTRLKQACASCNSPLEPAWQALPVLRGAGRAKAGGAGGASSRGAAPCAIRETDPAREVDCRPDGAPCTRTSPTAGRCNASPRCVLGRTRTLRVRELPVSLRGSHFAAGRVRFARAGTADGGRAHTGSGQARRGATRARRRDPRSARRLAVLGLRAARLLTGGS